MVKLTKMISSNDLLETDIVGEIFMFRLTNRGLNDHHQIVSIYMDDDETWHLRESFSAHWLDDLLEVINKTKQILNNKNKYEKLNMVTKE